MDGPYRNYRRLTFTQFDSCGMLSESSQSIEGIGAGAIFVQILCIEVPLTHFG